MDSAGFSGLSTGTEPDVDRAGVVGGRRITPFDRALAAAIQRTIEDGPVRLELWDGSSPYRSTATPAGSMVVLDRRSLIGLAVNPDLCFGESYLTGRMTIRGPLYDVVQALSRSTAAQPGWIERIASWLSRPNSLGSARRNVHHHYDLGNDFYALWLDPEMVYTCAYYRSPELSLDEAQRAKLDLVCRKLRLRAGETVVEAGCGWGALALHMARHWGVRVKAFNISREQLEFARDRAAREGLSDRVEFIDDDYRNLTGQYDAFVSVGMLEHVGLSHFPSLAAVLRLAVKRHGGRGLLHFIGRDLPRPLNAWIRRRIFPGAYTPTLAQVTTQVLGPAGMSVVDVENLRPHYARTLEHWSERFAAVADEVRSRHGEQFVRTWQLYLAGSQAAFALGWMQLFQVVFTPQESTPLSWTRSDPHEPAGAGA